MEKIIVNGKYEIEKWEVSNIGSTAVGTFAGKKYFLKKYGQYKMPRITDIPKKITQKGYDRQLANFNAFKDSRIAINEALFSFAGEGGNIMLPKDWFVDDINYVEATEFINDTISTEEVLKLPLTDLLFIMKTAAAALSNIHGRNIVHSDLKMSNILVAKNSSGKLVAKIIDFDRSYFVDKIRPDDVGGDQSFMSPELTVCFATEMAESSLAKLSTKSDIYSLGLVFYNFLTGGEFPTIEKLYDSEGKEIPLMFCGEGGMNNRKLTFSSKINKPYLAHLIANMVQNDSSKRPTAREVLEALKNESKIMPLPEDSSVILPASVAVSSASLEKYCTPWPEHSFEWDKEKLRASGYNETERTTAGTIRCYRLKNSSGSKTLTFADLKNQGFIKVSESAPTEVVGFCEPWPEHEFTWNKEMLNKMGYVSASQYLSGSIKCYVVGTVSGSKRVFSLNALKHMEFIIIGKSAPTPVESVTPAPAPVESVTPTPAPAPIPEPSPATETVSGETEKIAESEMGSDSEQLWPSDRAYMIDYEELAKAGYTAIEKVEVGGKKCYALVYSNGTKRNVNISFLKIMDLVKLK